MGSVQDDEAESTEGEEEGGGQAFHDVLAIDAIRHERHRPAVPVLISRRSYAGRLNYHIVYDSYNKTNLLV